MRLIAHRGNINWPDRNANKPSHVKKALEAGYDAEVDIWRVDGQWYLGHDTPQYKIFLSDWNNPKETFYGYSCNIWFHAKNFAALNLLSNYQHLKVFWHQNDDFASVKGGIFFWCSVDKLDRQRNNSKTVCMISDWNNPIVLPPDLYGVCSDYPEKIKLVANIG